MGLLHFIVGIIGRYGLPFVSPNNFLLTTITGIGAVIESTYVLIFIIYAPKKERARILGLVALAVTIFSTVALVSFFAFHGKTRELFAGVFVDIFAVAMFASPLSVMRLVIKTKSVEFMPFFLSLFGLPCAISWAVFGLINRDPFVIVPNALGSGLGVAQMLLYAIYHKRKDQHGNVVKDGSLEKDLQRAIEKKRPETHQLEHGRP
ncbi:Bidirectional sugar transporter SWEET [Psidium guajava]|nr:Bidirectional sugar transporter SWEET [Psidium guajava]